MSVSGLNGLSAGIRQFSARETREGPQVCRDYQRGNCSRGENGCRFSHSTNDTVCRDYIKGCCSREKCLYSHPPPAHLQAKIKAAQHQVNQATAAAAMSPFQRLAQQMQDVLGDGGVLKEVVQPGDGPPVPEDASVSFHFSGFLEYSDSPFDTTNHLKYPQMRKIGDVTVPGLALGLMTMRKGELSRFLLRPQYAFGAMGCPPLIPPAASVLYEVQLLDFLDSAEVDQFSALSPEQQSCLPLSSLLSVVETERSFGNRCFSQSRFQDAKDRYKQAVTLLGNWQAADEEEERRVREVQLPVLLNLSLVHLRLDRPGRALDYSLRALELCSTSTKALFRCGQAYLDMSEYEKARDYLTLAQANKPFDIDINNSLRKLAIRYQACLDQEKEMYSKMFAALNSPVRK